VQFVELHEKYLCCLKCISLRQNPKACQQNIEQFKGIKINQKLSREADNLISGLMLELPSSRYVVVVIIITIIIIYINYFFVGNL
jgi:hypothetical protein